MEKPQNDGNYFRRRLHLPKEPIEFSNKGTIESQHAVDIISAAGYRVLEKKFSEPERTIKLDMIHTLEEPLRDYATQVIIETNPKITKKGEPVEEIAGTLMKYAASYIRKIDQAKYGVSYCDAVDYDKNIEKEKPEYLKLAKEMVEAVKEEAKRIGLVEPKKSRGR